jgi:hypothetical protein
MTPIRKTVPENMVENLGTNAPDFKKFEKRYLNVSKKVGNNS